MGRAGGGGEGRWRGGAAYLGVHVEVDLGGVLEEAGDERARRQVLEGHDLHVGVLVLDLRKGVSVLNLHMVSQHAACARQLCAPAGAVAN